MNLSEVAKALGAQASRNVQSALTSGVSGSLRTEWLPDIPLKVSKEAGGAPAEEGAGKALARVFKPWLHLDLPSGLPPVDWAPEGRPGPSKWPLVALPAALVVVGVLVLAVVGARSLLRS